MKYINHCNCLNLLVGQLIKVMRKIRFLDGIVIVIVFLLLFSSYPYVFDRLFWQPPIQVSGFVVIALMGIIGIASPSKKKLPAPIVACMIIQSVVWVLYFLYHSDTSYLVRIYFIILTFTILNVLHKRDLACQFVKGNNLIIAIQAFLGLIAFVLFFIEVLPLLKEFVNIDGRPARCYYITCTNLTFGNVMRAAGFFDEPGALAGWGIFALVFNKLFINNRKIEIILIICLFSTLSAAYFIQIFLYFFFFYAFNVRKAIPVVFILCCFLYVYNAYLANSEIAHFTTERFEGGTIATKRTELAEMAYKEFLKSPIVGNGAKNLEEKEYMADNQFESLANDGILGTIVLYLPLILILAESRRKDVWKVVIILVAGYLQRPFHTNEMHYLFLYILLFLVIIDRKQCLHQQKLAL